MLYKSMLAFIWFGVGQVLSGLVMAAAIDIFGSKKACLLNVIAFIGVASSSISTIQQNEFNWISKVNCGLWGLQDGMINIHTLSILGFEFESKSEAFAVFILIQSLSALIF